MTEPLRTILLRIAYDAAGAPLGDSKQALALWRRFRTWTTTN